MIIYKVDRICMRNLTGDPNNVILYEDYNSCEGLYTDLNYAKNCIFSEIQRICINKNRPTVTIQELENDDTEADHYLAPEYSLKRGLKYTNYIYISPTAVNDGSRFIYSIKKVFVNDGEDKPYRGRKIKIEK